MLGDGLIDMAEFDCLIGKKICGTKVEEDLLFFKKLDIDCDGYITFDEVKQVVNELNIPISDQEIRKIIDDCDTDGDHRISDLSRPLRDQNFFFLNGLA